MVNQTNSRAKALLDWVDARFPLSKMQNEHLVRYYAPKNFNFWYYLGLLTLFMLVIQVISGIFLTMSYKPDGNLSVCRLPAVFTTVEYIMRDMSGGWIIHYMYPTDTPFFFIVVYLHMFRGLIHGLYKKPRELVWIFGSLVFLALAVGAFVGYLLSWGRTSFWGAQVIIDLFPAIPVIGPGLSTWICGNFSISDVILNRFFTLHVTAAPLVLIGLVVAHIIALHEVGSNNLDDMEIKKLKDENGVPLGGIPSHPYCTVKDILDIVVFPIVFCTALFFAPEDDGCFLEAPSLDTANLLKTPVHIAPVWHFAPSYAILRTIPPFLGTQVWGVIGVGVAMVLIALLLWLDRREAKSVRYQGPIFKTALMLLIILFTGLSILGVMMATDARTLVACILSFTRFAFFLGMPLYTRLDKTQPVPERVITSTTEQKIMSFVYIDITLVGAYLFATCI